MNWRPLFECNELGRSPGVLRSALFIRPGGKSMALVTFPERKVTRLPGRNPATSNSRVTTSQAKTRTLLIEQNLSEIHDNDQVEIK